VDKSRQSKRGAGSPSQEISHKRQRSPLPALSHEQQRLVRENIGLVGVHLRTRVPTPAEPMRNREHDDLFQEGCLALARAAARYNPDTDGAFGAYALARIRGAVFTALHERFSLIRIPPHALRKHSNDVTVNSLENTAGVTEDEIVAKGCHSTSHRHERKTVRHAIRERFERAIHLALIELKARKWRQRNPITIMTRIAQERLLVDAGNEQTPLRQIGCDFGISSGRVSAYERQLLERVHDHFARDSLLPLLLAFARRDKAGTHALLDEDRCRQLQQARCDAFARTFTNLERPERTELVCHLIERSGTTIKEVAHNLFPLTRMDETEPLLISA